MYSCLQKKEVIFRQSGSYFTHLDFTWFPWNSPRNSLTLTLPFGIFSHMTCDVVFLVDLMNCPSPVSLERGKVYVMCLVFFNGCTIHKSGFQCHRPAEISWGWVVDTGAIQEPQTCLWSMVQSFPKPPNERNFFINCWGSKVFCKGMLEIS